jgi:hypothetical protein
MISISSLWRAEVIPGFDPEAHNYWYNGPWVSTDVIMLLTASLKPGDYNQRIAHQQQLNDKP